MEIQNSTFKSFYISSTTLHTTNHFSLQIKDTLKRMYTKLETFGAAANYALKR